MVIAQSPTWRYPCSPFIAQQGKQQVMTLLRIVDFQLHAGEFLVFAPPGKPLLIWIARSGLPHLPRSCLSALLQTARDIFAHHGDVQMYATTAETTLHSRFPE
jgi:hypothetical protein